MAALAPGVVLVSPPDQGGGVRIGKIGVDNISVDVTRAEATLTAYEFQLFSGNPAAPTANPTSYILDPALGADLDTVDPNRVVILPPAGAVGTVFSVSFSTATNTPKTDYFVRTRASDDV